MLGLPISRVLQCGRQLGKHVASVSRTVSMDAKVRPGCSIQSSVCPTVVESVRKDGIKGVELPVERFQSNRSVSRGISGKTQFLKFQGLACDRATMNPPLFQARVSRSVPGIFSVDDAKTLCSPVLARVFSQQAISSSAPSLFVLSEESDEPDDSWKGPSPTMVTGFYPTPVSTIGKNSELISEFIGTKEFEGMQLQAMSPVTTAIQDCFVDSCYALDPKLKGHEDKFFLYMKHHCIRLFEPFRKLHGDIPMGIQYFLAEKILALSIEFKTAISEGREPSNELSPFPRVPESLMSQESMVQFLKNNPHVDNMIDSSLPYHASMDVCPFGDEQFRSEGCESVRSDILDKRKLVERALHIGENVMATIPENEKPLFVSSLLLFYEGYVESDLQSLTKRQEALNDLLKMTSWQSFGEVNLNHLFAVVSGSENSLQDLFESRKGVAFSARKIMLAQSQSGMESSTYLKLLVNVYQCHRLAVEEALMESHNLPQESSVFLRSSTGQVCYSESKGRYLFSDEKEAEWQSLEQSVLTKTISPDSWYFLGWTGTTQTFVDNHLSKGQKPLTGAMGDLGEGLYVAPDLRVASTFANWVSESFSCGSNQPETPVIVGVFTSFSGIDFETGKPRGTVDLDPQMRGQWDLSLPIVYNPKMRGFKSPELRFRTDEESDVLLPFEVKPCRLFHKVSDRWGSMDYRF